MDTQKNTASTLELPESEQSELSAAIKSAVDNTDEPDAEALAIAKIDDLFCSLESSLMLIREYYRLDIKDAGTDNFEILKRLLNRIGLLERLKKEELFGRNQPIVDVVFNRYQALCLEYVKAL